MHIMCPACGCTYDLPAAFVERLGAVSGWKRVRCRACGHVFRPAPQEDRAGLSGAEAPGEAGGSAAGPAPGVAEGAEAGAAEAVRPMRAARLGVVLGGGGLGLLAGALVALAVIPGGAWRLAEAGRLPASAREVLARLPDLGPVSLAAPRSPLEVVGEAVRRVLPDGGSAFEVSGTIRNPTAEARRVGEIAIRLMASDGRTLEERIVRPQAATIPAGGQLAFSSVAVNAPAEATRVAFALRPDPLDRF